MPTTPNGLPLASLSDAPNGPDQLDALANTLDQYIAVPTWVPLTGFASGANPDSPPNGYVPAYRVWWTGRVEIRGRINAGSTFAGGGITLLTLPAAARPAAFVTFPVGGNYSSSIVVNTEVQIGSNGALTLFCAAGQVSAIYLDPISYYKT